MPDDCFEHHLVGRDVAHNKEFLVSIITYNFKTPKYMYLVEVEKFKNNTFVIKYFLKKHKKHKLKYNMLSKEFKARPIVMTIINILIEILAKNKDCSFAFIGANTIDSKSREEESKINTKRFRVYRRLVENKIGPQTFTHFQSVEGSSYLLVNNGLPDVNAAKDRISNMFKKEYPELANVNVVCEN